MNNPFLKNPDPDFEALNAVISGRSRPKKAHIIEIGIDAPVLRDLTERFLGVPWVPLTEDSRQAYYQQVVTAWHRLGYECITLFIGFLNVPAALKRVSTDTDKLPIGQKDRQWVEEGSGLITNWREFEAFPWDEIRPDYAQLEMVAKALPAGAKMTVMPTLFTHVQIALLGAEGLSYLLHDDPELVAAVFDRWGQIIYDLYAAAADMEEIGAIWHADDLGFTTSTFMAPKEIRNLVMPWFQKFGQLAHDRGKGFWLHCCGNVYDTGVIEDLIDYAHLDAFHSFQDPILPVISFQERYGDRLAALGGVDMDKLCRLEEEPLRQYMREILENCMPKGRYVFGSGNTVTNYTPLEHYVWMLEEARHWRP
jgi:uroporphyrinogen decarboxylase